VTKKSKFFEELVDLVQYYMTMEMWLVIMISTLLALVVQEHTVQFLHTNVPL